MTVSYEFSLTNRRGQRIVGARFVDAESEREYGIQGTAVLMHGYSATQHNMQIVALRDCLVGLGWQVVTFDATHSFGRSDGETGGARLGKHTDDLDDLLTWMRGQDWSTQPLLLCGQSMGGYSVIACAVRHDADYLIPWCPVVCGEMHAQAERERMGDEAFAQRQEQGVIRKASVSFPGKIKEKSRAMIEEAMAHDARDYADQITCPVLVIAHEYDDACWPSHVRSFYDALMTKNKQYTCLAGEHHSLRTDESCKRLCGVVTAWLDQYDERG